MTVSAHSPTTIIDAVVTVVDVGIVAFFASFTKTVATFNVIADTFSTDLILSTARLAVSFNLTGTTAAVAIDDVAEITFFHIGLNEVVATASVGAVAIRQVDTGISGLIVAIITLFTGIQAPITADGWRAD
jgi:hypothetical protein